MKKYLRFLILGDVFGRPGREAVARALPQLKQDYRPDLVIANAENISHGNGVSVKTIQELVEAGVDVFTSGNHIYDKPEVAAVFEDPAYKLIRPLNFPAGSPGPGSIEVTLGEAKVLVLNLIGTVFAKASYDNPFVVADSFLATIDRARYATIIVDMHADASSEKVAMGYHLDGRVSVVFGTHTHVPTADGRILVGGTAYRSDVGMTGARNGVIGMDREAIVEQFLGKRSSRGDVADDTDVQFNAWLVDIDPCTAQAVRQQTIQMDFSLTN